LDLAAESLKEAVVWKTAIHTLLIIMSSNPEWAIDNLKRKEPTWYHQQLEDPPSDYEREKLKHPTPAAPPIHSARTSRREEEQQLETYRRATKDGEHQQLEVMKRELFEATKNGDYERIQNILKKKKISVNVMSGTQQDTPLMIACRLGMVDIVNLCLYYRAKNDPHPNIGQTALHCAVESRSLLCVQAILSAALPSQTDSIITNLKDSKNQQTPLHLTSSFGDVKIAKILIAHGADLSSRDKLSRTSLHICSYYGHKICLSYLLDSGGDSYLEVQDVYGNTALHYGAEQGHAACVKLLVETAANPIVKNNKGYAPYDLAQMRGHLPVCQILMAYNVIDPSPLPLSSSRGDPYQLERHATYPTSNDFHLPRPHSNTRSSSGGQPILSSSTSSLPLSPYTHINVLQQQQQQQQQLQQLQQMNQLYVDTAMSRSHHQNNAYHPSGSLTAPGSLTARGGPHSNLFQGLQLNNPLTARHMVDDELHNALNAAGYQHQHQEPLLSNRNFVHSSFSPVTTQQFFSTPSGSYSQFSNPVQTTGSSETEVVTSTVDDSTSYQPLEQFSYRNISWAVYQTDEGHLYYLDTATQHSQWDDPRVSGVIYYDETTGEYLQQEQEGDGDGDMSQNTDLIVEDMNEGEAAANGTMSFKPRDPSASKQKVEKKKLKQPRKIARVDDLNSDESDDGRPMKTREAFKGPPPLNVDDGDDSSDGHNGRMYVRSGKYSKRSGRSRGRSTDSPNGTPLSDDVTFSPLRVRNKKNIRENGEAEPDKNSTLLDDEDANRTNCFSPNKASLQRAATLKRNLSGVTVPNSPSNTPHGDQTHQRKKNSKSTNSIVATASSKLKVSGRESSPWSGDEHDEVNNSATMYSDQEEGEEESSDWDDEMEQKTSSQPTRTGPLGSIEHSIKTQSSKTPLVAEGATKSKTKSTASTLAVVTTQPTGSKLVKEGKLKKEKIFSTEEKGYGNGGNVPLPSNTSSAESPFTPQESPFLSVSTIKDGGFSPRPVQATQQLTNQQMISQVEPYLEMLRQGTSLLAVKSTMSKAGESRELIKFLIETADEQHIIPSTDSTVTSSTVSSQNGSKGSQAKALSPEELSALKQDPIIGKYVKMHAMGVPAGNIEQKMKLDTVEGSEIQRFMIATGQAPADDTLSEQVSPRDGPRSSKSRKGSVPLLKIHWSPLPAEKLSNSIFATARDDDDSMQDEEFEEFEKLFGSQLKAVDGDETGGGGGRGGIGREENPKMKLFVLEPKRAQNIIIGLTQFKSIASHSSLLRSICSLNDLNGQLTSDRLQNISQLLPTVSEMKKLPDAKDSHHPAEVFCTLASKYYPDLPKRLTCFLTCTTFQEAYVTLTQKMKKVIEACNEVNFFHHHSHLTIGSDHLERQPSPGASKDADGWQYYERRYLPWSGCWIFIGLIA
jgi:ankyrin repeat protein